MNEFKVLTVDEMYYIEAGCFLCKAGATIAGAATGAGLVLALASNPAGWAIAGGAIVGGGLGLLSVS